MCSLFGSRFWRLALFEARFWGFAFLRATPTANYVVKYKKVETEQLLDGTVPCELSAAPRTYMYDSNVWWVVLEPEKQI